MEPHSPADMSTKGCETADEQAKDQLALTEGIGWYNRPRLNHAPS
jgi:hypothetical protein